MIFYKKGNIKRLSYCPDLVGTENCRATTAFEACWAEETPQEEGLTDLALSKRPLAPEGKARPCGKTMDGGRRGGGLDPLLKSFGVVAATEEESQPE